MATGGLASSLTSVSPYDVNSTWNDSYELEVTVDPMEGFPYPSLYSWKRIILASMIVTLIMLAIVLGNILVVVAIVVDRRLKSVQHWFIASLAVSDLLVGLFIMPFSLATEVMGYWAFGGVICQLWLSTDVLLCTASILNLCLISLDRYWTITRPIDYVRKRTPRRAAVMISVVWTLSMVISLPPLVGWKRPQPTHLGFPLCQLSEELGYVVYSTVGSFYVPLMVMVLVYLKIYLAARARARRSLGSTGACSDTATVTMVPGSSRTKVARLQLPVVQVELDSSDELDCEENFANREPPAADRKQDEAGSETCTEEQQATLLTATTNEDTEKREYFVNKLAGWDSGHQLAIEYHDVDDEDAGLKRRKYSQSHGDDVIVMDSADRLLPQPPSPRSMTDVNAQRRAEFFGHKPSSPSHDHSEQVMSHLGSDKPPSSAAVSSCRQLSDASLLSVPHPAAIASPGESEFFKLLASASPDQVTTHLGDNTQSFAAETRCRQPSSLRQPRRSMIVDEQARSKRKLARARERRATLVLGIVMASFIGCWLPFFSIYPLSLLFDLDVPDGLFAVIFWLGYCNSALNPFIYTIFNRDFRAAFASILCHHRRAGKHGGPGTYAGPGGRRGQSVI